MPRPSLKLSRRAMRSLPLLAIIAASLLVYLAPVGEWLGRGQEAEMLIARTGAAAPAVFVAASAVLTGLGIPRLLFCSLAGLLFGFTEGFLLSHFGTVLGAYGMFLLARWSTPQWLLRKFPRLRALSVPIGEGGWWSVLLVRQLPIAGLYNDILLGWSPVGHRDFWIGTCLGFLPLGVTASLIGAGLVQADLPRLGAYLALATGLFFMLSLSLQWLLGRMKTRMAKP